MDRNSTNDNFEDFLRQNSEEFRLHPSAKVWEGISKDLNKKRRRYLFSFLSLISTSAIVGYTFFYSTLLDFAKPLAPSAEPTVNLKAIPGKGNGSTRANSNEPSLLRSAPSDETELAVVKDLPVRNNHTEKVGPVQGTKEAPETIDAENENQKWSAQLFKNNSFTRSILNLKSATAPFSIAAQLPKDFSETSLDKIAKQRSQNKLGLMFFFTPTISYRKLSENKSYSRSPSAIGVPYNYSALYNINNAVTHKPDMGFEIGLTTKYALSKIIKLRGGVQFNVNRYAIKAFNYVPEVATIALNNGRGVDSLSTISNYRNFNGGKTDWLQNFYFQISAPIGAEIKIRGNDKMYFGIASTIQPTYVLGDRAYMITADYKNYAQVPWLIRRWNVNTNLETFVAYSTGKVNWQVGPQVRYQLLSSFISEYPVKENLFDFGLKVGISLNQKDKNQ